MALISTSARVAALLATAGLALSPLAASAATTAKVKQTVPIALPLSYAPAQTMAWSPADETVHQRRWRRYRHHNGIDGGDVLGGLLIVGAVAAAAAAIDKDREERGVPRTGGRAYPYRDAPYDYRDRDARSDDGRYEGDRYGRAEPLQRGDTDRAVQACTAQAERNGRVDEVYDVEKVGGEWRVRGDYTNGREFTCSVDSNGRAYVGYGDQAAGGGWETGAGSDEDPVGRVAEAGDEDDRYAAGSSGDFDDTRGR